MNRWIILLCSLALVIPAQATAGKRTEGAVLGFIGGYLVGKHVEKNRRPPPSRRVVVVARSPMEQAFRSQTKYVRKQVQGKLKEMGFYRSYIDGYWGRGTRSALESFATEEGKTHLLTTNDGANELMSMLLRPEDAEQLSGPSGNAGAVPASTDSKGQDDLLDAVKEDNNKAKDMEDKKRMLKIAGQQVNLLNLVLRYNQKSSDHSPYSMEKKRALKDRISAIEDFQSQASIGANMPVVGTNMADASKTTPILPYIISSTNEIGEMRVVPRVSDNGLLIYDLDFREPGAGYANTKDTFSVYSVGIDEFMTGLEKVHKWSDIAKSKGIRQKHSKRAACFPGSLCKDQQAAGSAIEVMFMINQDGSTSARVQRNNGTGGYDLSVDTALILSAYLDYMKGEGEAVYTGGTMTKTDLDTLFK